MIFKLREVDMKTSKEIPKIYEKCKERFGVDWNKGVIITYGDTVYCKYKLTDQKKAHEAVHIKQQGEYGVEEWWKRYFEDMEFRRDQELEAYKAEVEWIKHNIRGFKHKMDRVDRIVQDISSSMYGDMIGTDRARELLVPSVSSFVG